MKTVSATLLALWAGIVSAGTIGPQPTLVVRFNFTDDRSTPFTDAQVFDAMAQVDTFYRSNSYGATWLETVVTPWLAPDIFSSTCSGGGYWGWLGAVDAAAAAAGYNVTSYSRRVYLFPPNASCPILAASTVGEPPVFLNGTLDEHAIAHELGHTFGAYHSHGGYCEDPYGCWSGEYDDIYDTMGSGRPLPHFNAFQKDRLGWFGGGKAPNLRTVTRSGKYRLADFENGGNPIALFWRSPAESFSHGGYGVYIEYRPGVGILIHTGGEIRFGSQVPDDSVLRDLDPGPGVDYVLDPGQGWSFGGLTVTAASGSVHVAVR